MTRLIFFLTKVFCFGTAGKNVVIFCCDFWLLWLHLALPKELW